jgi:hypothetical protein
MNIRLMIFFIVMVGIQSEVSGQLRFTLGINQPPKLELSKLTDLSASPGEMITLGETFMVTGGFGIYSFQWLPSEFLDNSRFMLPEAVVYRTTVFTLVVTDWNGCTDTTYQVVNVGGDAVPDERYNENLLSIYPVPAHNEINLKFPAGFEGGEIRCVIVNTAGVTESEQVIRNPGSGDYMFKFKTLPPGVYSLVIFTQKSIVTRRLIIN